jgi:uncharacterized protein
MFGLSLPKLLLLAIVLGAIWYGLKYLQARDRTLARAAADAAVARERARPARRSAAGSAEEMVKCPACGTYVAPDARACGRAGCPYRG